MLNKFNNLVCQKYAYVSLLSIFFCSSLSAKQYLVANQESYRRIAANLQAGDTVLLKNGIWKDFEIVFKGKGRKEAPITLQAQTKGKVILSGQSNLRISGEHLIVSGLVFKNGYTPSSEVIAFRTSKDEFAYHSRVTETVIDNFSNPDRFESDYWIALYGQYNRFDHNHLEGKRNKGVTLAVRLNSENSQQNYHKIDHNYFGPRPVFGSNGGETLRIGTSHFSLTHSFTLVENNYFDRCNGEVEIISVKSGKNQIKNNTFFESRGTLTLRHGNGNVIENNVFLGNGVDHTGGIRVINGDQIVRNNYLEGLTGYRFGSGFTVMNGVPNSPINRYHQVDNAEISNNSFINVEHIHLAAGSDQERSAAPINSRFINNLIFNENNQAPFSVFDDISGIQFTNNISNELRNNKIKAGIKQQSLKLTRADNGLMYTPNLLGVGVSKSLVPVSKEKTGANWYAKPKADITFASGKTVLVKADNKTLYSAVKHAQSGDLLLLEDGNYHVSKIIPVDKVIAIKAKNKGKVNITFERTALFQIENGGSLSLDGLNISGANSPDYSGNSVIRTAKWGMYKNYRFSLTNSIIRNLAVNHSFHLFDSGSRAFADSIDIHYNQFENISGDILRLNKENDDLGIYNAEYVNVTNNSFINVGGAVVKLYRGGRDESTFGPHLSLQHNQLNQVGLDKRNKDKASIALHGVQVTNIANNRIVNSAPIKVEHTVGEPISRIVNNEFSPMAQPLVKELYAKGKHTAEITNNKVISNEG